MRATLIALAFGLAALAPAAAAREDAVRLRDLHIESAKPRTPDARAGVIVVSMRGVTAGRTGGSVTFGALAPRKRADDEGKPPAVRAGFSVTSNEGRGKRDARLRVYSAWQAPPGRYVMTLFNPAYDDTTHPGRQYCFGAIGFDLAAGDVLYIGDYVGTGVADPAIDFDLDDARRALVRAPSLQQALRPASMRERLEFACDWSEMARFTLTDAERAKLTDAGALAPP